MSDHVWVSRCIPPAPQQLNLLSSLDHPNIVRYIGTEKEGGSLFIFLEYVPVGTSQQQPQQHQQPWQHRQQWQHLQPWQQDQQPC